MSDYSNLKISTIPGRSDDLVDSVARALGTILISRSEVSPYVEEALMYLLAARPHPEDAIRVLRNLQERLGRK